MSFKAAIIYAPTQSGKTWKCFNVLLEKLKSYSGSTCIIFITQANNAMSANQIKQRVLSNSQFSSLIDPSKIIKSNELKNIKDSMMLDYLFICDFWNARNMNNIYNFLDINNHWNQILIVIDECDQGDLVGVKARLECIPRIESIVKCPVSPILVTATIANFSNIILKISQDNTDYFKSSIVSSLINCPIIEKHFARPGETYVGANWFKTNWKELKFKKTSSKQSRQDVAEQNHITVIQTLKELPDKAKELCLIAVSTSVESHCQTSDSLLSNNTGFNVCVEINSLNNKNYNVKYVNSLGVISNWEIPWSKLDRKADSGKFNNFGILQKEDITLPLILQACIFMESNLRDRIKSNTDSITYKKLDFLSSYIATNLDKPSLPKDPKVAIIAGYSAGRGITFQDVSIDFVCTSFCFDGKTDNIRRGAINAQRFGRACGNLLEAYTRPDRSPIMITTKKVLQDAISNENVVMEKGKEFEDGSFVCIKDLVTQIEWDVIYRKAKLFFETKPTRTTTKLMQLLKEYYTLSNNGKTSFTYDDINKNETARSIIEKDHRRSHRDLIKMELIQECKNREFTLTLAGLNLVSTSSS